MNAGELSGASMGSLLSGPEAEGLGWYGHWYGHSFAETIPRTDSWSWAADPEDHWCGGILFRVRILPTERRACVMTQLVSYERQSRRKSSADSAKPTRDQLFSNLAIVESWGCQVDVPCLGQHGSHDCRHCCRHSTICGGKSLLDLSKIRTSKSTPYFFSTSHFGIIVPP